MKVLAVIKFLRKIEKFLILLKNAKKNDIIILPELSRAGRNMYEVNEIYSNKFQ